MAVWDSTSIRANRADSVLLRGKNLPQREDSVQAEPGVPTRWHPTATLAFIIVSCCLLWGGIFAAISLIF